MQQVVRPLWPRCSPSMILCCCQAKMLLNVREHLHLFLFAPLCLTYHTHSNGFIFPSTREHKILSKTPCRNHQTSLDELESLPPFTYSRLMRLLPVPHDGHGWNGPLYSTTAGRQWFPASHGVSWKEIQKQRISTWKNFIDHNGLEVGEFLRMFYLYL